MAEYGKDYFDWQKKHGASSAIVDLWKFQKFLPQNASVLDFGCGGGYLLAALNVKERYGVEVNPHAIEMAARNGLKVFPAVADIPEGLLFDFIISHHALEHVPNPLEVVAGLRKHLKPEGKMIFILPFDDWRRERRYDPTDVNKHLFTWTPLLIGNLFADAGFRDIQAEVVRQVGIPKGRILIKYIPGPIFAFLRWLRSLLQGMVEIRVIAGT